MLLPSQFRSLRCVYLMNQLEDFYQNLHPMLSYTSLSLSSKKQKVYNNKIKIGFISRNFHDNLSTKLIAGKIFKLYTYKQNSYALPTFQV